MALVLHSIMFGTEEVQLSYSDTEEADAHGTVIHTPMIVVEPAIQAELAELRDAAEQLLAAWKGMRRETGPG